MNGLFYRLIICCLMMLCMSWWSTRSLPFKPWIQLRPHAKAHSTLHPLEGTHIHQSKTNAVEDPQTHPPLVWPISDPRNFHHLPHPFPSLCLQRPVQRVDSCSLACGCCRWVVKHSADDGKQVLCDRVSASAAIRLDCTEHVLTTAADVQPWACLQP